MFQNEQYKAQTLKLVVTLPATVTFPVTATIVIQILGVNISCTTTSPPRTSGDTRTTINNFKSFSNKDDYNSNKIFSKCSFHSCYNLDICNQVEHLCKLYFLFDQFYNFRICIVYYQEPCKLECFPATARYIEWMNISVKASPTRNQ